jgi:hypothetical protein
MAGDNKRQRAADDEGSNKEGKGSKGNGDGDEGGRQQRGQGQQGQWRQQQGWHATKRAKATVTRGIGGEQVMVTRAISTATVTMWAAMGGAQTTINNKIYGSGRNGSGGGSSCDSGNGNKNSDGQALAIFLVPPKFVSTFFSCV